MKFRNTFFETTIENAIEYDNILFFLELNASLKREKVFFLLILILIIITKETYTYKA